MSSFSPRALILLVEDSDDDAFFFRRTLTKSGLPCDLVHAADGAAAVQQLERALAGQADARRPDLVFLDLKIPTLSGFEVLAWIRQRGIEPPLDVAVLSGSDNAGDIARAQALGASAYYVKPITIDQLQARYAAWQQKSAAAPRVTAPLG